MYSGEGRTWTIISGGNPAAEAPEEGREILVVGKEFLEGGKSTEDAPTADGKGRANDTG